MKRIPTKEVLAMIEKARKHGWNDDSFPYFIPIGTPVGLTRKDRLYLQVFEWVSDSCVSWQIARQVPGYSSLETIIVSKHNAPSGVMVVVDEGI